MLSRFQFLLLIVLFIISAKALKGQCPASTQTLRFALQSDLTNFGMDYPACINLTTDVEIDTRVNGPAGGSTTVDAISHLNALNNIEDVAGEFKIHGPPGYWTGGIGTNMVMLLPGMTGLTSVDRLIVDDMPDMEYLNFSALETVKTLILKDLPELNILNFPINGLTVTDTLILENVGGSNNFDFSRLNFPSSIKVLIIDEVNFENGEWLPLHAIEEIDELTINETNLLAITAPGLIDIKKKIVLKDNYFLEDISPLIFPEEMDEVSLNNNPLLTVGVENFLTITNVIKSLSIIETNDISFFNSIAEIGNFLLFGTDVVKDLSAFNNLEVVGDMDLRYLTELTDMSMFSSIEFVGTRLTMIDCGVIELNDLTITNFDFPFDLLLRACENLVDIDFLETLTDFRNLSLQECPMLQNLDGLSNLRSVSNQFTLAVLPNLESLQPLLNFNYVRVFDIIELPITNLEGLAGLRNIESSFTIIANPLLENLDALSNLEYLGIDPEGQRFIILNNPALNSIDGLSNLKGKLKSKIEITGNLELDNCSIDYICSNISYQDAFVLIENNKGDCNSVEQVIELCGFNYLEVYLDSNGDGQQNIDEPNLSIGQIQVGDQFTLFPNNEGRVGFFLEENPGFIAYEAEPNWEVISNNAYTPTPDLLQIPDLIKIGIKGTADFLVPQSYLSVERIVCDREYDIIAIIKNRGTEPFSATIRFEPPGDYVAIWPFPADTTNSSILFDLGEILPGQSNTGLVQFIAPSITDIDINSVLEIPYTAEITAPDGSVTQQSGIYEFIFLCAYDPNDKQVFPPGVQAENYTLFDEADFEYIIRFQNTGNFPAQDVFIVDTLDQNLDLSTFEFINASHEVSRIKMEDEIINFEFRDIFLLDSISNEPESHGFVHFKIKAKENLPENTIIENTGFIYFDFNPAIITNTVHNTLVSVIPTSSISNQLSKNNFTIFPNPTQGSFFISQENVADNRNYTIFAITGSIIQSGVLIGGEVNLDLHDLKPGVYFVKVNEEIQKFIVQ